MTSCENDCFHLVELPGLNCFSDELYWILICLANDLAGE